jgi:hypothetical protein
VISLHIASAKERIAMIQGDKAALTIIIEPSCAIRIVESECQNVLEP